MTVEIQIQQLGHKLDQALRTNQRQLADALDDIQQQLNRMEAQMHRIEMDTHR